MDRHGRARRTDPQTRRRPPDGYRLAGEKRFVRLVQLAVLGLGGQVGAAAARAELAVADVPPPGEGALLVEFEPPAGGWGGRLTLYRRPLELRADSKPDLVDLMREAARNEISDVLGLDD